MNIAEELLLLLMDEQVGEYTAVADRTLGYALTGAVLIELDMRHRIDVSPQVLVATDPTPLDDDLLDPVLADIVDVSCDGAQSPEPGVLDPARCAKFRGTSGRGPCRPGGAGHGRSR